MFDFLLLYIVFKVYLYKSMECDCMCIMYNLLRFFVDSFLNIDIIILRISLFCMNG